MSIIDTIKQLIKGSPDAQVATQNMISTLAAEAVKTGNPDALVAVAAQWENLMHGSARALPQSHSGPGETAALTAQVNYTTADEMKPIIIRVMQQAYLAGVVEITNGVIKKAMNTYMLANGGWKDGDLQDNNPAPGIQPLWWSTLSSALYELRQTGDVSNDPQAWRTYALAPHNLPQLSAAAEAPALQAWEPVA